MPTKTRSIERGAYRDRLNAQWPVEEFFEGKKFTKSGIAREFGITDAAIYVWQQRGSTGLEVFKAMMMMLSENKKNAFLAKVVVGKSRASAYNERVRDLAEKFDHKHQGLRLPMDGGGWYLIPERKAEEPVEAVAAPEIETPAEALPAFVPFEEPAPAYVPQLEETQEFSTPLGPIKISFPINPKHDVEDVLIAVAERLRGERDRLFQEWDKASRALLTKNAEIESLRVQLLKARDEIVVYESLLGDADRAVATGANGVTPRAAQAATTKLKHRPALLGVLEGLPKTTAPST